MVIPITKIIKDAMSSKMPGMFHLGTLAIRSLQQVPTFPQFFGFRPQVRGLGKPHSDKPVGADCLI